jgi:hypothetical protein
MWLPQTGAVPVEPDELLELELELDALELDVALELELDALVLEPAVLPVEDDAPCDPVDPDDEEAAVLDALEVEVEVEEDDVDVDVEEELEEEPVAPLTPPVEVEPAGSSVVPQPPSSSAAARAVQTRFDAGMVVSVEPGEDSPTAAIR